MEKLASTAKSLDVVFKVLQHILVICMIVVLCILTVLTIVNAVNPNAVIGDELNTVDIGPVTFELGEEYTPANGRILACGWASAVAQVLSVVILYLGLNCIRSILRPMAEGNPFHPDTARYMKKLAGLSLALGIVQNVGNILESTVALRSFNLDALMEGGMIRSVTVNYTFDLGFVIVFFVLLLMSYIFSYGAQLQQLSDETL